MFFYIVPICQYLLAFRFKLYYTRVLYYTFIYLLIYVFTLSLTVSLVDHI